MSKVVIFLPVTYNCVNKLHFRESIKLGTLESSPSFAAYRALSGNRSALASISPREGELGLDIAPGAFQLLAP